MKNSERFLSLALSALSVTALWMIAAPQAHSDGLFLESDKPWVKEMSPVAGRFLLNDRPISYGVLKPGQAKEADSILRKCLALATEEDGVQSARSLVVESLCNLASFCYRQGNYDEAAQLFERGVKILKESNSGDSAQLADLMTCLTLVYRASNEYEKATQCLSQTLAIRKKLFGEHAIEVASTYMELAQIAHDSGDDHGGALWEDQAMKIAGTEFVSRFKSPDIERPVCNSALTKEMDFLPQMLESARAMVGQFEVQSAVREQARVAKEQENIRKAKAEADRLAAARAAALAALNKSAGDDEYSENAPGFATITGRALYPINGKGAYFITKEFIAKKTTTETKESKGQNAVPVPIEIAICKTSLKDSIARKIVAYAEQNNQDVEQFGEDWPATRLVARPLMNEISELVVKNKIPKPNWLTESNDSGEYVFHDIPKGKYIVYVQLWYEDEYLYWLIPLEVSNKKQITLDILPDNVSHYVWRKARDNHAAQM